MSSAVIAAYKQKRLLVVWRKDRGEGEASYASSKEKL